MDKWTVNVWDALPQETIVQEIGRHLVADPRLLRNETLAHVFHRTHAANRAASVEAWLFRHADKDGATRPTTHGFEVRPTLANVMEYYLARGDLEAFFALHGVRARASASSQWFGLDAEARDAKLRALNLRACVDKVAHGAALVDVYRQQFAKLAYAAGRLGRTAAVDRLLIDIALILNVREPYTEFVSLYIGMGRAHVGALDWFQGLGWSTRQHALAYLLDTDETDAVVAYIEENGPESEEDVYTAINAFQPRVSANCASMLLTNVSAYVVPARPGRYFALYSAGTMPKFSRWTLSLNEMDAVLDGLAAYPMSEVTARYLLRKTETDTLQPKVIIWALVSNRTDLLSSVFGLDAARLQTSDFWEPFGYLNLPGTHLHRDMLASVHHVGNYADLQRRIALEKVIHDRLRSAMYMSGYRLRFSLSPDEWRELLQRDPDGYFKACGREQDFLRNVPADDPRYDAVVALMMECVAAVSPAFDVDVLEQCAMRLYERADKTSFDRLCASIGEDILPAFSLGAFRRFRRLIDPGVRDSLSQPLGLSDYMCALIEHFSSFPWSRFRQSLSKYATHACVREVIRAIKKVGPQ
jgi:hypothetical protein